MVVYYCDKCGKDITNQNKQKYDIHKVYNAFGYFLSDKIHLCSKCEDEFENWLKGKEIVS